MNALDVSGDGFIEYQEFLAAVVDRQRTLTDHTIAEMFGRLQPSNQFQLGVHTWAQTRGELGGLGKERRLLCAGGHAGGRPAFRVR